MFESSRSTTFVQLAHSLNRARKEWHGIELGRRGQIFLQKPSGHVCGGLDCYDALLLSPNTRRDSGQGARKITKVRLKACMYEALSRTETKC